MTEQYRHTFYECFELELKLKLIETIFRKDTFVSKEALKTGEVREVRGLTLP